MRLLPSLVLAVTTGLLAALMAAPASANHFRHSGAVVDAEVRVGTIHLAEVGSWQAVRGVEVIRLTILVTDATEFVRVRRAHLNAEGFSGDFVEESIGLWDIYSGDVVTVECVHEGSDMIATKVTLVELER